MNEAMHILLRDLQIDRGRLHDLRRLMDRAQQLLVRHQWGAEGHCPECAAEIGEQHTDTCEWYELMARQRW